MGLFRGVWCVLLPPWHFRYGEKAQIQEKHEAAKKELKEQFHAQIKALEDQLKALKK